MRAAGGTASAPECTSHFARASRAMLYSDTKEGPKASSGELREPLPGVVCGSTDCVTNQIELRCSGVRSGVNCVPEAVYVRGRHMSACSKVAMIELCYVQALCCFIVGVCAGVRHDSAL